MSEDFPKRRLIVKLLRAVGLRLVVWGGLSAFIFFYISGGFSRLFSPSDFGPTAPEPNETQTDSNTEAGSGWPHLRGPNFNCTSDETGIADHWPENGPPVLWVREIGQGYSALTVVGKRVYTQRQTMTNQTVLCLDADTGKAVWEHTYGWPYKAASMYPGPRATPTVSDGGVYYAGPNGLIGCLRAEDGQPVWEISLEETFQMRGFDFGYAPSPTVIDGKVILPVGGEDAAVVALDARDGSVVWTSGDEPASYSSIIPINFKGQSLLIAYLKNSLSILETETGKLVATWQLSQGYDEHSAMPIYKEPRLLLSGPFRSGADVIELLHTTREDDSESSVNLRLKFIMAIEGLSNDVASSVLVDGNVYGFDLRDLQSKSRRPSRGLFKCFDFTTGELRWKSEEPGHASPIAADGKLLILNDRGEILLVRATSESYEELGRSRIFGNEICWTTPTLADGRLFLRSPTRVACVLVGEKEIFGDKTITGARPASEIPQRQRFDFTWLLAGERDAPADPPDWNELLRWYLVSLWAAFGIAGAISLFIKGILITFFNQARRPTAHAIGRVVFWSVLCVLGIAATAIGNRLTNSFIFTWPVSIFAIHQFLLVCIVISQRDRENAKRQRITIVAVIIFILTALAYFALCRSLDLAVLWIFLMALLPSWIAAVPAAYMLAKPGSMLKDIGIAVATFSIYFWITAGMIYWLSG